MEILRFCTLVTQTLAMETHSLTHSFIPFIHTHLLFNKTVINGIRAVDDFDAFVIYGFLFGRLLSFDEHGK